MADLVPSKGTRSLTHVLIAAFLAVILIVSLIGVVATQVLMPILFDSRARRAGLGSTGGGNGGRTGGAGGADPFAEGTAVSDIIDQSLLISSLIASAIGIVIASMVAWAIVSVITRQVDSMRRATARLASGETGVSVAVPQERELADLARSINSLGQSLADAAEARARLLSDLAHEIRNPLTTIQGSMEGVIDGVVPATDETFMSVAEEAERLARLSEDLSTLARSREGALRLQMAEVDMVELVSDVLQRLKSSADLAEVSLAFDATRAAGETNDEHPIVLADRDRISQVLINLVGNALTHTPKGGDIQVSINRAPGEVIIEVADTGPGIPVNLTDSVFDRYTRFDPQVPGTGIGLNIARSLVHAHGGTISAANRTAGSGATFTVSLPAPPNDHDLGVGR